MIAVGRRVCACGGEGGGGRGLWVPCCAVFVASGHCVAIGVLFPPMPGVDQP